MSARSNAVRLSAKLVLVLGTLLAAVACEPVQDEDYALEIQTSAMPGISPGTRVSLHVGIDEEPSHTWEELVQRNRSVTFGIKDQNEPHPREFLWMTTQYQGPDDVTLDFTVLIGEYGDVRDAAGEDGVVTGEDYNRVLLSSLRFVESVMLTDLNGGEPIRSAATLSRRIDELDGVRLLDSATALQVAITTQVPGFPEELVDTSVIVDDQALVSDLILTAGETNPNALAAARADALRSTEFRTGWASESALGDRLALFQPGYPGVTGDALHFESDTAGWIGAPEGRDSFTWSLAGGVVEIDFAGEMSWEGTERRTNSQTGETEEFAYTESFDSATINRIAAGQDSDLILYQVSFNRDYEDEELDDTTRSLNQAYTAWRGTMDAVPAAAEGTWSLNLPQRDRENGIIKALLQNNGMGQVLKGGWFSGETINWETDGGRLGLVHPNGRIDVRFLRASGAGWFALISETDDTGTVVREAVDLIGRGDDSWPGSGINDRYLPYGGPADPSANSSPVSFTLDDENGGVEGRQGTALALGWSVENGDLILRNCFDEETGIWSGLESQPAVDECDSYRQRTWDLLTIAPSDDGVGNYLVIEDFRFWNENALDEEPDGAEFRQVYYLEREEIESGEDAVVHPSALHELLLPGRGHPDSGISGSDPVQ